MTLKLLKYNCILIWIWFRSSISPLTKQCIRRDSATECTERMSSCWAISGGFWGFVTWMQTCSLACSRRVYSILVNVNRASVVLKMVGATWYSTSKVSMKWALERMPVVLKKNELESPTYQDVVHKKKKWHILPLISSLQDFFSACHLFTKEFRTYWAQTTVCETLYCW